MTRCIQCQTESDLISSALELCVHCIREFYPQLKPHIDKVHAQVKKSFGLPPRPPQSVDGLSCSLCVNQCKIAGQEVGYCGTRYEKGGKLFGGGPNEGHFSCPAILH